MDNWDFITWDPAWATRQLDLLLTFASKVDLTVDRKKTFMWSTDPDVRQQCRQQGIPVSSSARDLGAHIAFSKRYSNHTIKDRLRTLEDLWPAIRRSPSPHALKVRVLSTVAWPRGLHAVSSAPVASTVWNSLRSKATQAIIGRKAGVNPQIFLGLLENADPEDFALQKSVNDAREFSDSHFLPSVVAPLAFGLITLPPNAPAHILMTRLHRVGIMVTENGLLQDRFGTMQLFDSPQEVALRLSWAWHQHVAASVAHRVDFKGLSWVDTVTTRNRLLQMTPVQQALFRLQLAGGSITADYSCHWTDQGLDVCQWCGGKDSLEHRFWTCSATAHLRAKLAPKASSRIGELPPALALSGWALHAPSWIDWTSLLISLPRDILPPACSFPPYAWVDIFTDGSCLWQNQPSVRIASWSSIIAQPCARAWNFEVYGVLGSSYLPGLLQTSYRAELYALAYSLHWASCFCQPVRIWSDCLGVINRFLLVVKGKRRVKPNSSHADLWEWVLQSVSRLGVDKVQLQRVPAHRSVQSARTLEEAWKTWNNGAADRAAKMANVSRPPTFWKTWQLHAAQHFEIQSLYEEVVNLQLAVAELSIKTASKSHEDLEFEPVAVKTGRQFSKHYDASAWDLTMPVALTSRYGYGLADKVVNWWQERVRTDDENLCWIPFTYLYIDFQLTYGCPGPLKVSQQWFESRTRQHLAPEKFPHRVRVRWFRNFLGHFWKNTGIKINTATCKPDVDTIQAFVPSVSLAWDPWCLDQISRWLRNHLAGPCARSAKELRTLPLATHLEAMNVSRGSQPTSGFRR